MAHLSTCIRSTYIWYNMLSQVLLKKTATLPIFKKLPDSDVVRKDISICHLDCFVLYGCNETNLLKFTEAAGEKMNSVLDSGCYIRPGSRIS